MVWAGEGLWLMMVLCWGFMIEVVEMMVVRRRGLMLVEPVKDDGVRVAVGLSWYYC